MLPPYSMATVSIRWTNRYAYIYTGRCGTNTEQIRERGLIPAACRLLHMSIGLFHIYTLIEVTFMIYDLA